MIPFKEFSKRTTCRSRFFSSSLLGRKVAYSNVPNKVGVLLDNVALPQHQRTTQTIIGKAVGNSRKDNVGAIPWTFGFNVTRGDVPLNNLNAMHTHKGPEIFIPSCGEFRIRAGTDLSTTLSLGDFIVVPPGVERSFECIKTEGWCPELKEEVGNIITVLIGKSWVQWSTSTIKDAQDNGAYCTEFGTLIEDGTDSAAMSVGGPQSVDELIPEVILSSEQFNASIYRANESPRATVPFNDGALTIEVLNMNKQSESVSISGDEDTLVMVLRGSARTDTGEYIAVDSCFVSPQKSSPYRVSKVSEETLLLVVRSTISM